MTIAVAEAMMNSGETNYFTLVRDIGLLQPAECQVLIAQPVDLFPWTRHVETVVLMSKTEAGKA